MDNQTEMKPEHFNMLVVWRTTMPTIKTAALADNLQRRFGMDKGTSLILACRFSNELHTRGLYENH